MTNNDDRTGWWKQLSRYSGLAVLLPLSTFIGYGIGYFLDKLFHTHFLYVVFLLLGIAAGFVELFRELSKDASGNGT